MGDRDHIENEEDGGRRRKKFSPQVRDVPTDLRLLDKAEDLEIKSMHSVRLYDRNKPRRQKTMSYRLTSGNHQTVAAAADNSK